MVFLACGKGVYLGLYIEKSSSQNAYCGRANLFVKHLFLFTFLIKKARNKPDLLDDYLDRNSHRVTSD